MSCWSLPVLVVGCLTAACSLTGTQSPRGPGDARCSTSYAAPVMDATLGTAVIIGSIVGSLLVADDGIIAWVGVPVGAATLDIADIGVKRVRACREAKHSRSR